MKRKYELALAFSLIAAPVAAWSHSPKKDTSLAPVAYKDPLEVSRSGCAFIPADPNSVAGTADVFVRPGTYYTLPIGKKAVVFDVRKTHLLDNSDKPISASLLVVTLPARRGDRVSFMILDEETGTASEPWLKEDQAEWYIKTSGQRYGRCIALLKKAGLGSR